MGGEARAHGGQKRALNNLRLELQALVSYLMWVLGTELLILALDNAARVFNCNLLFSPFVYILCKTLFYLHTLG